jgi:hypothetical protein
VSVALTDDALEAKEKFLKTFGPHDHDPDSVPNSLRRTLHAGSPCGWFWCGATLEESVWMDLAEALEILRKRKLDPRGLDVITVAQRTRLDDLANARGVLEEFDRAARRLLSTLWPNGSSDDGPKRSSAIFDNAGRWAIVEDKSTRALVSEAIERIGPLLADAKKIRPDGQDPRLEMGPRAALATALDGMKHARTGRTGWTMKTVAAALLLTGVKRGKLRSTITNLSKVPSRPPKK